MNAKCEQGVMGTKRRERLGESSFGGGGGGRAYSVRATPKGRVFVPFWSKNKYRHIGLESGMDLEGTTGVYERIYRFNSTSVRKRENYANSK